MGQRYRAWATRALLHGSPSVTRMVMVMGTFPIWRSRAGSLMWDWRGWSMMGLEKGFRCKAVTGWGSRRGEGRRRVNVLHGQAEVQVRQPHTSAPVWRRHAGWSSRGVYLCKPTTGGVTAGRAYAVSIGSQSFGHRVEWQILRGDRFNGWGDLNPWAGSWNRQRSRHHPEWVECRRWEVFCGMPVLARGHLIQRGHVGVMGGHQQRWLIVILKKSSYICNEESMSVTIQMISASFFLYACCLCIFFRCVMVKVPTGTLDGLRFPFQP